MLDSIWIVSTHFCMLPPPTQHLVKKTVFITVDEHTYTRNSSLYCVTDYVRIIISPAEFGRILGGPGT